LRNPTGLPQYTTLKYPESDQYQLEQQHPATFYPFYYRYAAAAAVDVPQLLPEK
jgi:hypothetical protein